LSVPAKKVLTEGMNLGQQVVSLALARRLKELGVKQESYFAWYEERYAGDVQIELAGQNDTGPFRFRDCADLTSGAEHRTFYAAFTVAELGDLLPAGYPSGHTALEEPDKKWICHWYRTPKASRAEDEAKPSSTYAHTEADARAKMLICLIEHNLMMP
jgi:hypothetical protein